MKSRMGLLATACAVLVLAQANGAEKTESPKLYSYVGMNGQSHDMEVYFPKEKKPQPATCAVFFHGGGWTGGGLGQFRPMCEYFASRGMVCVTANYSMHPKPANRKDKMDLPDGESKKRICVIDGKSVIRWVKQHADELGIDPNRIVAGGGSAGGHIAVLSMLDEKHGNPNDPAGVGTDVKAFLLFCPAFTLPERDGAPDVNVFNHLDKPIPPTLFLVGETDGWKTASDALAAKLAEQGRDVENWMAPGHGHMFFRKGNWMDACLKKADEFLVARGLLDGKSPISDPASGEKLIKIKKD